MGLKHVVEGGDKYIVSLLVLNEWKCITNKSTPTSTSSEILVLSHVKCT
jgi:hypothetical protein